MKSSIKYLDDAKEKLELESDYAISKLLNVGRAAVSQWRNGKQVMDDYAAAKIAVILEIDPMLIISAANAEREKEGERRDFWKKYYERLGGMAASFFVAVILNMTPTPSQAAPVLNVPVNQCILC